MTFEKFKFWASDQQTETVNIEMDTISTPDHRNQLAEKITTSKRILAAVIKELQQHELRLRALSQLNRPLTDAEQQEQIVRSQIVADLRRTLDETQYKQTIQKLDQNINSHKMHR